jgi:hypothetical protein
LDHHHTRLGGHCRFRLSYGWLVRLKRREERAMNEDKLNVSLRKFLKTVGVTSQREIEKAIRDALESGKLKGNERLAAKVVLTLGGVNLSHEVKGEIELE